jgi:hypothetical protein
MKISTGGPQMNSNGKFKVDSWVYSELKRIVELKPWHQRDELVRFFGELSPYQKRTNKQSRALHLFFTMLSEALNLGGLEMKIVLKYETEIWWTPESVKIYLWKPLQKAMFGKESTTELEKQVEIDKVHEQLMHLLGEKHGVEYIPFPSELKKEEVKEIDYPEYQGKTAFD